MKRRTQWTVIILIGLLLCSVAGAAVLSNKDTIVSDKSNKNVKDQREPISSTGSIKVRPYSDTYLQYVQNKDKDRTPLVTSDGKHGLGWVPSPTTGLTTTYVLDGMSTSTAYPASYDLRTVHKVSSVKDQGMCGSCWAFASMASLEGYLLPSTIRDWSENHMKNRHDFDYLCCDGGNIDMAAAYLSRFGYVGNDWDGNPIMSGPVLEGNDPYSPVSCTDTYTYWTIWNKLHHVYILPPKTSPTDNNLIKYYIMNQGPLYAAFQWEGYTDVETPWYNPTEAAYCDLYRAGGNHAVTIIGWDDNYPASKFSSPPPGNGAYICKNSWGTSFGKSGYFYVSYYDKNMGYVETAQLGTWGGYTKNYQYDPFGHCTDIGTGDSDTMYGGNIWTASYTLPLRTVGFYTAVPNTQYSIDVYVNPAADNPASGTKMVSASTSGTLTTTGYYTKILPTYVPLTAGQKFSVVMKFTTPGDGYPLPVQTFIGGYNYENPGAVPGQSFFSVDGTTWDDCATYFDPDSGVVVNIKAMQ
jgi:C1A family cysteine protease